MPPVFWDVDHQILLQQHMAWIFLKGVKFLFKKKAQASQRFWLFCFTLGQEAEEWNLLLLQAQLGENWFFVCFSGPKWHLTGDHCMNNPQLTPHFLRGSNDARSYPNNKTICQRWFKFIQKFQGIQKSNIFARKSIVVVFFRAISDPKNRSEWHAGGPTTPHKDGGGESSGFSGAEKSTSFSRKKEDAADFPSILVSTSGIFRRCSLCFRFQKPLMWWMWSN